MPSNSNLNKIKVITPAFICLLLAYQFVHQPPFANRTWLLTSTIKNGEKKEITRKIYLHFYNFFNVAIDAGCEQGEYNYKIRFKNRLVLYDGPQIANTQWCVEREILQTLIRFGGTYKVQGSELRIHPSPGQFLVFTESLTQPRRSFSGALIKGMIMYILSLVISLIECCLPDFMMVVFAGFTKFVIFNPVISFVLAIPVTLGLIKFVRRLFRKKTKFNARIRDLEVK